MGQNFSKPFKTVDEQIAILKGRNVDIPDEDEARRFLLRESYYSVINGYKDAFLDNQKTNEAGEDRYKDGTTFTGFMLLFVFDRALRRTAIEYLMQAEATMKTASVYAFCYYNRDEDAYLDPASYCTSADYSQRQNYTRNLIKLLGALQRAHDNKKKDYVKHYLSKHKSVPLWVIANTLTFGNMSAFYDLQKNDVQNAICANVSIASGKEKGSIGAKDLRKAFRILPEFRNICAHEERLYCARVGKTKEFSFKDMVDCLAVVLEEKTMNEFVREVERYLSVLGKESPLYSHLLRGMGMDEGYLDRYSCD